MMNVLVTGASGFLASHFCRQMSAIGWQVHVLLRETSSLDQLDRLGIDHDERVTIHRTDGTHSSLVKCLQAAEADVVCHCASLFISEHQPEEVDRLIDSNILFGTKLLEAMSEVGPRSLVNVGTSWQHFESDSYRPVNLYAATKEAFADVIQFYTDARGMRCIDLKLYDVYGPLDPRKKLLPLLKELSESGKCLDMSPGEQEVELNYVDDVVEALGVACKRVQKLDGGVVESYGVSGERCTLKELVATVEKVLGKPLDINWGARAYRQREVMTPWVPKETLPGWEASVGIEEGLKRLFHDE